MIYPDYLKKGDTIAITAPSAGSDNDIDIKRLDLAKKQFEKLGFKVIETPNCRTCELGRSSSAKERGEQFNETIKNKDVKAVICLAGGEYLIEALPYIDFKLLKENPKWIQGYSDPTGILYSITTNLDIATIYGYNFKTFSMNPMHNSLINHIDLLTGKKDNFSSFEKFEDERKEYMTGEEPFKLNKKVEWINLNEEKEINITGRLLGGCIDIIQYILGTRYDGTLKFIEKYKDDGIIWFFDNCELSSEFMTRLLWKINELGYFKYTKGIVFGRTGVESSFYDLSFKDTINKSLSFLKVPIILEADLGHKPPVIPIINGSIANIVSKDGKGEIKFWTK